MDTNHSDIKKEQEPRIDLIELFRKLWNKKRLIVKTILIGGIIGVVIAFSIPKEYTTTVTLITEYGKTPGGNMGALASMAGITLGGMDAEILTPEIYPSILNSTTFIQNLLQVRVLDSSQDIDTTLHNYIKEYQKQPWWNYVLDFPQIVVNFIKSKDDDSSGSSTEYDKYFISESEMKIIDALRNSCVINSDTKSGLTTLEVTLQSPKISAYLADTLTSCLQEYIINQRTQKAKVDLSNAEKLYNKAKIDYYKAQEDLGTFLDGNINVISARYRINQEKLQNEASSAYLVYNQMVQQVQLSKIKVQDDTPVFTVIQSAVEPIYPSKPKKKVIVIAFVFLGFVGACGWILGLDSFINKKNR